MPFRNTTLPKLAFAVLVLLSGQVLGADRDDDSKVALIAQGVVQDTPLGNEIDRAAKDLDYYWKLQDLPAALAEAERIVLLLAGEQSRNQAMALHNLAKVQQSMGQHLQSEKNYRKSVRLIERKHGNYAPELLTVLSHQGSLYYDTSDYELATAAFRKAQHITHRLGGVYSLEQLELIDWITLINIKTGQSRDADTQQRFYYSINLRNYGENDPRLLPAINKMADWFKVTGQFSDAVKTYEKALVVIEKNELMETEKLQPLRGISTVLYLKGSNRSVEALGEALQIVTEDPASDHMDELDALVHLADMHMIKKRRSMAKKYYQLAWNKLGAENPLAQELFGRPELLGVSRIEDVSNAYYQTVEGRSQMNKVVYRAKKQDQGSFSFGFATEAKAPVTPVIGEPLSLCHSRALELAHTDNTQDLEQYFVDVDFTVTKEGGVSNVSLVESNAPSRLQRYVTNILRRSRYRPTLWKGETVDTDNIKLRQTFSADAFSLRQTPLNRISADGKRAATLGCQLLAMNN